MARDIKSLLSARDRDILNATTGSSWVPEDPVETILPYISEEIQEPEDNSIEDRRIKAQKVLDGYEKIEKDCDILKAEIAERCKNVVVDLNPQEHLSVIDAIKRVFGTDGMTITFQMYQRCISELAQLAENGMPNPMEKGK